MVVEAVVDEVGVAAEGAPTDIVVMGMMVSVVGTEVVAGNFEVFSQLDLRHTLYYTLGSVNCRTHTRIVVCIFIFLRQRDHSNSLSVSYSIRSRLDCHLVN